MGDAAGAGDDAYRARQLEERVGADERTAELGIRVTVQAERAYLHGTLASAARRDQVLAVVAEAAPDLQVVDELTVADVADTLEPSEEKL